MEDNAILVGDCLEVMADRGTHSCDLIFADPPFNIGYDYDKYNDKRPYEEYLAWTDDWLKMCRRLLKPTGTIWVAIGDEYAAEMKLALEKAGFLMRNWVIWHYTFGVACQTKFSRSHAHLFYYVKDRGSLPPARSFTFNADAVRVASARQTAYGDRRAASKGKLPDDTWILRPSEEEKCCSPGSDTWLFSRVCGTFNERTKHPCQMPEAILERIIRVSSNPGDLVFDPFAGSGTTLAAAKKLGRRWLGVELSEQYAADAILRLDAIQEPVHGP